LSTVFLKIFSRYILSTSHNQFGFKKGLSCSHAIYSVRNSVKLLVDLLLQAILYICMLLMYLKHSIKWIIMRRIF